MNTPMSAMRSVCPAAWARGLWHPPFENREGWGNRSSGGSKVGQPAGDSNYAGSTSPPITVNVQADFSLTTSVPSMTVTRGGSGTLTLTITGETGYNSTINFTSASCSGLPRESTCSFSPPSITGSGSTTLTVTTTAPHAAMLRGFEWTTGGGMLFAGVLLLGVPSKTTPLENVAFAAGVCIAADDCRLRRRRRQ